MCVCVLFIFLSLCLFSSNWLLIRWNMQTISSTSRMSGCYTRVLSYPSNAWESMERFEPSHMLLFCVCCDSKELLWRRSRARREDRERKARENKFVFRPHFYCLIRFIIYYQTQLRRADKCIVWYKISETVDFEFSDRWLDDYYRRTNRPILFKSFYYVTHSWFGPHQHHIHSTLNRPHLAPIYLAYFVICMLDHRLSAANVESTITFTTTKRTKGIITCSWIIDNPISIFVHFQTNKLLHTTFSIAYDSCAQLYSSIIHP